MPTDVHAEVVIVRPPEAVAAVMFDPGRDAEWTTGVVGSRAVTEGPLREGSVVERDVRFAGRRFTYRYEVMAADPYSLELRVDRPFPMAVTYRLEPTDVGTRTSIRARGDAGGFFKLAGPLLNGMVRRNVSRDLQALKGLVENAPG
jgi:Polyketide cyclase / dehydrase and lipid transport